MDAFKILFNRYIVEHTMRCANAVFHNILDLGGVAAFILYN